MLKTEKSVEIQCFFAKMCMQKRKNQREKRREGIYRNHDESPSKTLKTPHEKILGRNCPKNGIKTHAKSVK